MTQPGRQVALIRGINVGNAKRVAMADLRALVEMLGYEDCQTVLNSGNLIFTAANESPQDAAARIQQAMKEELGVEAPFTALTAEDFQQVIEECRLAEETDNPSRLLISFLLDPSLRSRLEPLQAEDWQPESFDLGTHASYAWCPDGVLKSNLLASVEKALGQAVTSRNWKTVQKIQASL